VGQVFEGANYILVDDHIGFGGTLANMRGYVLARGARTTLTETPNAATIALAESTLNQLRNKHGSELDDVWRERYGYGLDCCTEVEAGKLLRMRSIDFIRRCLAQAEKKAGLHSR
jgi:hypothetical protein